MGLTATTAQQIIGTPKASTSPTIAASIEPVAAAVTGTKESEFIRNAALEKVRQVLATP